MFLAMEKIFLKSKVYRPPHEIQNKSNPNSMNKNSTKYQLIQQKSCKIKMKNASIFDSSQVVACVDCVVFPPVDRTT